MRRQSAKQFGVDSNVRCTQVYPVFGSNKPVSSLKTVGLKLTREQAIHLAQVLLAASKEWLEIDITAFREPLKSELAHRITVTSLQ